MIRLDEGTCFSKRTAIIAMLASGAAYAANGKAPSALASLESTSQVFLIAISAVFLLFGIVLTSAGFMLYMKKVKGAYKPAIRWKIAAFSSGGLGMILLLSGLMGVAIILISPLMARSVLY